jgi:hypothetical protein
MVLGNILRTIGLEVAHHFFRERPLRWTPAVCYSSRPASAAREKLNEIK